MVTLQKHQMAKMKEILEETGFAYNLSCESLHLNTDYADYATSHSYYTFKNVLEMPDLTQEDLCFMLRRASKRASRRHCQTPWSVFMLNHISRQSNNNAPYSTKQH